MRNRGRYVPTDWRDGGRAATGGNDEIEACSSATSRCARTRRLAARVRVARRRVRKRRQREQRGHHSRRWRRQHDSRRRSRNHGSGRDADAGRQARVRPRGRHRKPVGAVEGAARDLGPHRHALGVRSARARDGRRQGRAVSRRVDHPERRLHGLDDQGALRHHVPRRHAVRRRCDRRQPHSPVQVVPDREGVLGRGDER